MDPNFAWVYLAIFLLIPLARIIPRFISRRRMQNNARVSEKQYLQTAEKHSGPQAEPQSEPKPRTKEMLVLGALNRGSKNFESIQKNTGLGNQELDKILETLEKDGLLEVRQKQGVLGTKIELHPTGKGFKEYYS